MRRLRNELAEHVKSFEACIDTQTREQQQHVYIHYRPYNIHSHFICLWNEEKKAERWSLYSFDAFVRCAMNKFMIK